MYPPCLAQQSAVPAGPQGPVGIALARPSNIALARPSNIALARPSNIALARPSKIALAWSSKAALPGPMLAPDTGAGILPHPRLQHWLPAAPVQLFSWPTPLFLRRRRRPVCGPATTRARRKKTISPGAPSQKSVAAIIGWSKIQNLLFGAYKLLAVRVRYLKNYARQKNMSNANCIFHKKS